MNKKIVVITGSPRKNGNSLTMTKAFIKAATDKGHCVTVFDATQLNIDGCQACETCFKRGKACSFDDDFNSIAPAILEADIIIYTMPVYWYSIPAKIKTVIDKTFTFGMDNENVAGKGCRLICCCAEDDISVMDGVRIPIERTAALLNWHMIGEVLIPGVQNPGEIEKTDGREQAIALAERI